MDGGANGERNGVRERLARLEERVSGIRESLRNLRSQVSEIASKIRVFVPDTGEIQVFKPMSRELGRALLIALGLIGSLSAAVWRHESEAASKTRAKVEEVALVQARARADLSALADAVAVTVACVRVRFADRRRGLSEGQPLAAPSPDLEGSVADCEAQLREAADELRALRAKLR